MLQCENLIRTLDQFNTAIYLKDITGRYLSMNTNGINIMNGPPERVLGKTSLDIFDHYGAIQMMEADQYCMKKGGVSTSEVLALDKESFAPLPMFTAKTPILSPSGEPLGVVGISLVGYQDADLFSEACRMLPNFVQTKQPRILNELLELRTVTDFMQRYRVH